MNTLLMQTLFNVSDPEIENKFFIEGVAIVD